MTYRQFVRRCTPTFLAVGFFSLIVNILTLSASIYMMQVYDRVLTSHSVATLIYLTLLVGGLIAVLAVIDGVRSHILAVLGATFERELASDTLSQAHTAALRQEVYTVAALRDLATLRGFVASPALLALFDLPWMPLYAGFIFMLHPVLGVAALVTALLLIVCALINDLATRRRLVEAGQLGIFSHRALEAGLRNAEVLDAMGMLPDFARRWRHSAEAVLGLQQQATDRGGIVLGVSKFLRLFAQIAVLGLGAWLVIRQDLTSGAMAAASIILGRALAPIEQAIGTWRQTVQARQAWKRLMTFLARPPLRPRTLPLPPPQGRLSVEGVTFLQSGCDRPILSGISFALEPGRALGIIGPSAAGKSTLGRLLVGSRPPSVGHVRLDGAELFRWNRAEIGRHIGYLPQEVELFGGSVADNIARLSQGEPAAIVEAAQLAGVHETILALPKGYETEIGEGGGFLSGGQRQRIALARALFGRPRLVVLDEPNANLDAEGEEALGRAVAALKEMGATVVVIGHRPSTLLHVDRILVLRQGQMEMLGPRGEVLDRLSRRVVRPVSPSPMAGMAHPQPAE